MNCMYTNESQSVCVMKTKHNLLGNVESYSLIAVFYVDAFVRGFYLKHFAVHSRFTYQVCVFPGNQIHYSLVLRMHVASFFVVNIYTIAFIQTALIKPVTRARECFCTSVCISSRAQPWGLHVDVSHRHTCTSRANSSGVTVDSPILQIGLL